MHIVDPLDYVARQVDGVWIIKATLDAVADGDVRLTIHELQLIDVPAVARHVHGKYNTHLVTFDA